MHVYVHACMCVCVPMWFLAGASVESGLPVGAVHSRRRAE